MMHPDGQVRFFKLPDTRAIRRHFERYPDDLDVALLEYGRWTDAYRNHRRNVDILELRSAVSDHAYQVGALFGDWCSVLRCAQRRLELGLSVPPWWDDDSLP